MCACAYRSKHRGNSSTVNAETREMETHCFACIRELSLLKRIITSHVVARDYSHTNYSTSNRRVEKENRADIFTGELIVLPNRGSDECWLWWMFRASGNVFVKNSLRPRSTFHSLRDVRPKFVSTREMENRNPDFSILPNEISTGNGRNGVYRILGIPTR